MSELKGSEIIAQYFIKEKMPYILGYSGHGDIGLLDGIYDYKDKINVITPRIEQAAGFMADVYFRITGLPLPVYASTGPGPLNMTIALGNAFYDSSAFLLITGQVTTDQFDTGALQEEYRYSPGDFVSTIRPLVKHSWQIRKVEDLVRYLPKAFKLMRTGRPGPCHLEVPYDLYVRKADVEVPEPQQWSQPISWRVSASPQAVERVLDLLVNTPKSLILAGGGTILSGASEELKTLASRLDIPVYTTLMGKGAMSEKDDLYLGVAGCWGDYPAVEAARNADLILAIGVRFADLHCGSWLRGYTYNIPPTKLIQVDIDESEIARNYPVEMGIVADAKTFLGQMLATAKSKNTKKGRNEWRKEIRRYKVEWQNFKDAYVNSNEIPIDPRRVLSDMRRVSPDETILVSDVGNVQAWVEQYWATPHPKTHIAAGGFSAMGFGVCGVLGAKLARPDCPCICVCGDGSFMMMPHAVATAVEYDLPVVWVVLNNYSAGCIRDLQRFYLDGREIGTSFVNMKTGELWNPDFAKMAEAMGAKGFHVEKPKDFAEAFEDALNSGVPAVLDVIINRDTPVPITSTWQMPPIPTAEPTFGNRRVRY